MDKEQNEVDGEYDIQQRKRQLVATEIVCHVINMIIARKLSHANYVDRPIGYWSAQCHLVREELLMQLSTNGYLSKVIRMGPETFRRLCDLLQTHGGLQPTQRATVQEQVVKFLHILTIPSKNITMSYFYRHSGETVSRHFHRVLRAVIALEDQFLQQPTGEQVLPEILNSARFYPYFKDCVGAIDATHVRVKVPNIDAAKYRGRKEHPTQNVLAACSLNMRFTYVLPGWEGTASDSRIIKNALTREDKLIIPNGKYYLVDAGFMLRRGLLTPYRNVRYHLKEYSSQQPQNFRELFNLRHSSLRNAIERAFGVLKKLFPIIGDTQPTYSVEIQSQIVLACCILHNFLMEFDPDLEYINEVDEELASQSPSKEESGDISAEKDHAQGESLRNEIAMQMWNDYIL
ncbi:uncharacterized protein [Coffea arabica]|uniref:Uncharacterized protein n=1 Tax=Coffea arabica TaxID=13443 RepID=A0A6P6W4W8_COFAR|nr:putative nuclease HARBI1 [Coffea arabica]